MSDSTKRAPSIDEYSTIEAWCDGAPIRAFGYTYVLGVSPDLQPGAVMQDGNDHPAIKIVPKASWEIGHNLCGSTPAREPKTAWNDDQPLLPIHLIDGDPETAWSSRGGCAPDRQPEWIRIDLAAEATVASVALVCSERGPGAHGQFGDGLKPGKALPRAIEIRLARDARAWETVYATAELSGPDAGATVLSFAPRRAKQVWIVATDLQRVQNWGHAFSIGEIEVRDPEGNNLALASRGAGVTVSSTFYGYGMDRFTQDMLWPIQYDLGFTWTRVGYDMSTCLWAYVERERGKLEIDPRTKAAIVEAHENGMNVILCLDKGNWLYRDPPRKTDWRRARFSEMMETYFDHQGWPHESDALMAGWLRYVDYMVREFRGKIAYFEICNEWQGIGIENYIRIARETIPVIRRADPGARIMLGSTGGFDRAAVLACLRSGLGPDLDAVGWHPFYQSPPDSWDCAKYRTEVEEFRKECAEYGFDGQLAATEWTWAAPYPGAAPWCSEMQKAKYSAQLMVAHCGMDVISLYNETFQTGRIDWDCTLLRNAFAVDPISPAQPQPIYYALRTISTALDGFRAAPVAVSFGDAADVVAFTFRRSDGAVMLAAWLSGPAEDVPREVSVDISFPGTSARHAWAIDVMNGTEQELVADRTDSGTTLRGILIKDYPTLIRLE